MKRKNQAWVVQTLDSAIQLINIGETNCVIQWIEIYPADSAMAPFEHLRPEGLVMMKLYLFQNMI